MVQFYNDVIFYYTGLGFVMFCVLLLSTFVVFTVIYQLKYLKSKQSIKSGTCMRRFTKCFFFPLLFLCALFLFTFFSFGFGSTVLYSDFCVNPEEFIYDQVGGSDAQLLYFTTCIKTQGFTTFDTLESKQGTLNNFANDTRLEKAALLCSNSTAQKSYLDEVSNLKKSLVNVSSDITNVLNALDCEKTANSYVDSLHVNLCHGGIEGLTMGEVDVYRKWRDDNVESDSDAHGELKFEENGDLNEVILENASDSICEDARDYAKDDFINN
eukprot:Pgem_evm1s20110